MKKKINIQFIITNVLTIILTAVLCTAVFYNIFKKEILNNLKTYADVYKSAIKDNDYGIGDDGDFRITIIDTDGTVEYDNSADAYDMTNHLDRPEVKEALENGEGKTIRRSDTMNKNTFYYAVKLDNGMVLRVSKEADSIWSMLWSAFPIMAALLMVMIAMALVLTNFLAKSIISPIENVAHNMDNLDNVTVYKEMQPFVTTIKEQHDDIMKNAMMRQEFTANVSHELKTPLTSISGYSELIENGMAGEEDIVRFAGEIHRSANRLLALINDILRLSQLDSGQLMPAYEQIDLYEQAENCISMLELHAKEHDVTFHLDGGPTVVQADRRMVEEIIYNLCDNAIRYNREGGNVWVVTDPEEKSILVSDDGIGISQENQKRIFERFYRVDKSRSKKTGGTGLGLAIVKHIVEQHNARIELTSAENVGTTIKIIFN